MNEKRLVGIVNERMTCYHNAVSKVDADNHQRRDKKREPDYPVKCVNI